MKSLKCIELLLGYIYAVPIMIAHTNYIAPVSRRGLLSLLCDFKMLNSSIRS